MGLKHAPSWCSNKPGTAEDHGVVGVESRWAIGQEPDLQEIETSVRSLDFLLRAVGSTGNFKVRE